MYLHPIPLYLPAEFAKDSENAVSMTNKNASETEVPRTKPYSYAAIRNEQSKFYDAYFFGQLFSLYQSSDFPRGNLDAGRLNYLFDFGVLVTVDAEHDPLSLKSLLRLDVKKGFELFGDLLGSPGHEGFDD